MGKTIIKYIARFLVEAETPLFVGSGQSTLLKDSLVQKDANGFPMIPGTTLAGVLRHSFSKLTEEATVSAIFGDSKGGDTGTGSLINVSPALMMLDERQVSEGLLFDTKWDALKDRFNQLPVRQHVRMTDKGVAEKNGLFDNEVIFKGTRFVFELELTDYSNTLNESWTTILKSISSPDFRIGAGSRNGYGSLKVLKVQKKRFDLKSEMIQYLELSPSFNAIDWNGDYNNKEESSSSSKIHYKLKLAPDPFFIFGSGYGDEDVDNTPVTEEVIKYTPQGIRFVKENLVPGSSVKGAISHRVAFHYNKEMRRWAGTDDAKLPNEAVSELFGKAGKGEKDPKAGKVFINDVFLEPEKAKNDKIFNHVALDRFTGGALEGALFSEKVSYLTEEELEINLFLESNVDEVYKKAFIDALMDICKGLLPLGGMTTKGHGIFTGLLLEDGNQIFPY
ncbi:RAMP superfamily CRISPR-associated protein [Belliella sp. DSM 111904]|uniref:RAMP superfamily CRISPR-associated protein n=1 Tax=Belliella filtrata TaxID=2923435 RepID=A0ABS9V4U2_9BACT|nr:RAMP superfamily CRISPR-associated protein [Belliella filtrata]MCH7411422.1 RAMP superfamily CRISPR-associated protein [Belliella filtrata]